ncbi:hypothetical protein QFC21_006288 [Naganishia friedmannii]|uniref:Uncharacterized protein n=1 Tax=Naganishia friedmannii TaxID=89922 RepID=A0ACC2V539_9TREE|nr:hypothetical protein QFC21_006288 [Naganishia friedmannii]
MALPPHLPIEPSKLINSLGFESKGLSHPVFLSHSRNDGKEARLVVKAVYRGPTPGWPILDKKRIYDNAHKTEEEDRYGASAAATTTTTAVNVLGTESDGGEKGLTTDDVPICLAETNPVYPIHVIVRIALAMQPGACDDMLKAARAYSQLSANGYLPYELPVAIWRTAEGIWSLVLDEGGTALPSWWEQHVQPQIHASESRWKIGSWRAASAPSADGEPGHRAHAEAAAQEMLERHHEEHQEQKKRIHFLDEAAQQIGGLLKEKEQVDGDSYANTGSNTGSGSAVGSGLRSGASVTSCTVTGDARSRQERVMATLGEKADEMRNGQQQQQRDLSATSGGGGGGISTDDGHVEISPSKKQEWASRIQQQKQDMQNVHRVVPRSGETTPVADGPMPSLVATTKTIGVDEDEEEAMVIDRGWLPAVNILIQLADIILVILESRPFVSRSSIPSPAQSASVQLTHFGIVVQMPGYEGGKVVGHMNADFDGDKVLAMGPGSASAFTNFGTTTGKEEDEEGWMAGEDEGVGALQGVLDEASILRHLQYIAPEAISSRKAIASTVDIFSWGMTAYEMLKGKGLEGTDSDEEIPEFFRAIHLHSTRTMSTLTSLCPSMPPELSAIIKKALALDPDDRYMNVCGLLHDLQKVAQICDGGLRENARREFTVGQIDQQSRFAVPPGLLDREEEFAMLEEAYQVVKSTGKSQVACCWGTSGTGKSKLLEMWARQKESDNAGQDCFVSWAKMDQHLVKPLSAFISVFCSLLERVFSDPLESAADWRQRILDSLAVNANVFLALLPKEWRAILLDGQESEEMGSDMTAGIDWESWVKQFRTWSYGLLRLFASENRPLLIIIDDVQWLEKSEQELWGELITSETRRLDHCLILFSYRTQDDSPPNISPFTPRCMIKARAFSEETLAEMIYKCFHLEDVTKHLPEQWAQLCSFLYKNTRGNAFDLKWTLSTLVRDGDIYYDYVRQEWIIRTTMLNAYPERNAEDFAQGVLNSLSQQARVVLCHLACLPSRGVEIPLLAQLTNKNENAVRALLDECATLGSINIRHNKVQFVHDKPHAAALALIDPQEKPRLFAKIARSLEGVSADYNFVRADMFLSAYQSDPSLLELLEVVKAAVKAARQAAASAALDLASSYLDRAAELWSFSKAESWEQDPDLAMDFLTVTAEVALGRRAAAPYTEKVESARRTAPRMYTKLDISPWLFKLYLSAARPDLAMKSFFDVIRLLGYDTPSETTRYPLPPINEKDIRSLVNAPAPPNTEEAKEAISLSNLIGTVGPSFYSYEADQGWRIMQFVIPIYLHNHAATKHSSTAYSWYVMAILLANGEIESLEKARAYIELGDSYNLLGSPVEAIAETAKVTLGYIKTHSLKTIDYSRSYQVCYATNNYDVLSYTLGLDLSAQALSGHSISELYTAGRKTLTTLADDLQPAIRLMTVPFVQFGANLLDAKLLESKSDFQVLSVLEGEFVTAQDAVDLSHAAAFYAVVYALASLFLGLLFNVSPDELRKRAALAREKQRGGSGTILGAFAYILLSITTLILNDDTDTELLDKTYAWLHALPHNADFQSTIRMLKALEIIKDVRQGKAHWRDMIEPVEEAIETLEIARSYLFTGLMCTQAEVALQSMAHTKRIRRNYLHYAQSAFKACEAKNLVRFADVLLGNSTQSSILTKRLKSNIGQATSDLHEDTSSQHSGLLGETESSTFTDLTSESNLKGRKLGLEQILRSFLLLASERNSEGLIRRVLQVLLQVTCTSYACFATQDPSTGSLKLKGFGAHDSIETCDIPIAEAKEIAPTVLLSHASITKKPINASNISSPTNANLLRREPFFAATGVPKTLLLLPLFVQGRFSGLLFLSGKVSNATSSTSQVGLLATFAAIILQSFDAYASLEAAVEIRTQQLQHALHSRSTFISGVSHEIRTPLFAINGLCAVMESSADLTDTQRENLQVISQSADDLQRIVTAVLDWSKLDAQSITPESIPFDLRSIIENALETVAHLARSKNIRLLLENPVSTDPPGPLLGDPHRYRQCLLNLLSNAIKFTKPTLPNQHSTVSVSWSWQDHPDKVEITCAVRDEGIGIPAKAMHRLFNSFSQVDSGISRNFGGTGLGLQQGECWSESVEGQGSTFYLLITADKAKAPDAEQPQTFPPGPPRRAVIYAPPDAGSSVLQTNLQHFGITTSLASIEDFKISIDPDFVFVDVDEPTINSDVIKILRERHQGSKTTKKTSAMDSSYAKQYPLKICYIDDSNVNVAVGKKILSKFGYKDIDVCYDGRQAVEAAERTKYDLMLMDLQMPNMDGHTARKLISENQSCGNPLVVALTANCDQATKDRCLQEGFADFLTKPLIISDLAKLLVEVYETRQSQK